MTATFPPADSKAKYNLFLLLVAGLGGLLYGVDVGIISGALPYLTATSKLSPSQLSYVVAAVLLGSVISTLFAGLLADALGRKFMMIVSGILFVASIPIIALSNGYYPLISGRLLQGISGGFIGVVVPLYLAECLGASSRGKGTAIFQWLLTLGIVAAALIGVYYSGVVDEATKISQVAEFAAKDNAWRKIFWVSMPPGILFVIGSFIVAESPRWLFLRGRVSSARVALLRSRSQEQTELEIKEMEETAAAEKSKSSLGTAVKESLLRKKYIIPFVIACIILACNQTTGINSIIAYATTIFIQSGLGDKQAHVGYLLLTCVNFLVTIAAVVLVDRKGRKFLLSLGSAGIIVCLLGVGVLFHQNEKRQIDVRGAVQAMVSGNSNPTLTYDHATAKKLLAGTSLADQPTTILVIYSYGDFQNATTVVHSDDASAKPLDFSLNSDWFPDSKVSAFFKNPFANLTTSRNAPLHIDNAIVAPIPSSHNGWLVAACLFAFMSFFAIGPGVCVWLALSELMPTRIRSNGMSIALVINQTISATIAAIFLPTVGKYGYSTMFYGFAACTVVYFVTAAFFLPETKGKTLEEIEEYFEGHKPHTAQ